jgi:hypothetical protein
MCLNDLVKVPLGPLIVIVLALTEAWTNNLEFKFSYLSICYFTIFWDIDSI